MIDLSELDDLEAENEKYVNAYKALTFLVFHTGRGLVDVCRWLVLHKYHFLVDSYEMNTLGQVKKGIYLAKSMEEMALIAFGLKQNDTLLFLNSYIDKSTVNYLKNREKIYWLKSDFLKFEPIKSGGVTEHELQVYLDKDSPKNIVTSHQDIGGEESTQQTSIKLKCEKESLQKKLDWVEKKNTELLAKVNELEEKLSNIQGETEIANSAYLIIGRAIEIYKKDKANRTQTLFVNELMNSPDVDKHGFNERTINGILSAANKRLKEFKKK